MKINLLLTLCLALVVGSSVVAQTTSKPLPVAEFYEGGKEALLADIKKAQVYPPVALRNRKQGECIVAFMLEPDGTITTMQLVKNEPGAGCGEEAMRIVKNLKFKAPGYRVEAKVPVQFSLPQRSK